MASIGDMKPGDLVKTMSGEVIKVASVYGVDANGRLAKPSEGGFGVIGTNGERVTMWDADRYIKAGGEGDNERQAQ